MQTRAAALAAWLIGASLMHAGAARADQRFSIHDRVAADEIEEVTTLIIDGKTIRSFHLDAVDNTIAIEVVVPDAESHEFGLCGHILIRTDDGTPVRRSFDISGLFHDVDGRDFEAVAADDYRRIYFVDTTPGRAPGKIDPLPGHACQPIVSMR